MRHGFEALILGGILGFTVINILINPAIDPTFDQFDIEEQKPQCNIQYPNASFQNTIKQCNTIIDQCAKTKCDLSVRVYDSYSKKKYDFQWYMTYKSENGTYTTRAYYEAEDVPYELIINAKFLQALDAV